MRERESISQSGRNKVAPPQVFKQFIHADGELAETTCSISVCQFIVGCKSYASSLTCKWCWQKEHTSVVASDLGKTCVHTGWCSSQVLPETLNILFSIWIVNKAGRVKTSDRLGAATFPEGSWEWRARKPVVVRNDVWALLWPELHDRAVPACTITCARSSIVTRTCT